MASKVLIDELREIMQANTNEVIDENEFREGILSSLNLKDNNEIVRALSIMVAQANVNPEIIGSMENGSFKVSAGFSSKVIETIKYENKFIEGTEEYVSYNKAPNVYEDVLNAGIIIFTPQLIDKMIKDYDNLPIVDVNSLWGQYENMDSKQRGQMIEAQNRANEKAQSNPDISAEDKEILNNASKQNNSNYYINENAGKGDTQLDVYARESFAQSIKEFSWLIDVLEIKGRDIASFDIEEIIKYNYRIQGIRSQIQYSMSHNLPIKEFVVSTDDGERHYVYDSEKKAFYNNDTSHETQSNKLSLDEMKKYAKGNEIVYTQEMEISDIQIIASILSEVPIEKRQEVGDLIAEILDEIPQANVRTLDMFKSRMEETRDIPEDVSKILTELTPALYNVVKVNGLEQSKKTFQQSLQASLNDIRILNQNRGEPLSEDISNDSQRPITDRESREKLEAIQEDLHFDSNAFELMESFGLMESFESMNGYLPSQTYEKDKKQSYISTGNKFERNEANKIYLEGKSKSPDYKPKEETQTSVGEDGKENEERQSQNFFSPKKANKSKIFKGVRFGIVKKAQEAIKQLFTRDREETEQGLGENE